MTNAFCAALAASAAIILSQAAQAADIPVKAPRPVAVYNWTGFYVGVNAGYAWDRSLRASGDSDTGIAGGNGLLHAILELPDSNDPITAGIPLRHNEGVFGGGQAGYNWQFAPTWVAGLEADIQAAHFKGNAIVVPRNRFTNFSMNAEQDIRWFGTLRARLGFLAAERVLIYGTGGLAFGETKTSGSVANSRPDLTVTFGGATDIECNPAAVCLAGSQSKTSAGWTAGGGAEVAVTDNVTVKLEYLHVDLAGMTTRLLPVPPGGIGNAFLRLRSDNSFDLVRAGLNWRY